MSTTPGSAAILPFQPSSMSPAQLSAISYLARYAGATHALYAAQLRRWFAWCDTNGLDPLIEIQRAHVELYIRQLGEDGLMDSSVNTISAGSAPMRLLTWARAATTARAAARPAGWSLEGFPKVSRR